MLLHVTVFERGTGLHNIHKLVHVDFVQSAIAATTKKKNKTPLNEAMQFGFQYIKLENSNHESNCREQISSKYRIQIVSSLKRLMLIKYT